MKTFNEIVFEKVVKNYEGLDELIMSHINNAIIKAIPLALNRKFLEAGNKGIVSIEMGTFGEFKLELKQKGDTSALIPSFEISDSMLKAISGDFEFNRKAIDKFKEKFVDEDMKLMVYRLSAGMTADGKEAEKKEDKGPLLSGDLVDAFIAYFFLTIAELLYDYQSEDEEYVLDIDGHGEYHITCNQKGAWVIVFTPAKEFKQLIKNDNILAGGK
jgi:hypothetical protein